MRFAVVDYHKISTKQNVRQFLTREAVKKKISYGFYVEDGRGFLVFEAAWDVVSGGESCVKEIKDIDENEIYSNDGCAYAIDILMKSIANGNAGITEAAKKTLDVFTDAILHGVPNSELDNESFVADAVTELRDLTLKADEEVIRSGAVIIPESSDNGCLTFGLSRVTEMPLVELLSAFLENKVEIGYLFAEKEGRMSPFLAVRVNKAVWDTKGDLLERASELGGDIVASNYLMCFQDVLRAQVSSMKITRSKNLSEEQKKKIAQCVMEITFHVAGRKDGESILESEQGIRVYLNMFLTVKDAVTRDIEGARADSIPEDMIANMVNAKKRIDAKILELEETLDAKIREDSGPMLEDGKLPGELYDAYEEEQDFAGRAFTADQVLEAQALFVRIRKDNSEHMPIREKAAMNEIAKAYRKSAKDGALVSAVYSLGVFSSSGYYFLPGFSDKERKINIVSVPEDEKSFKKKAYQIFKTGYAEIVKGGVSMKGITQKKACVRGGKPVSEEWMY